MRTAEFSRTPLGRRGLSEDEVSLFLARVAEDLAAADAEKADLRGEINRLRNYYRQHGVDVDGGEPREAGAAEANSGRGTAITPATPDLAAINLMSRAQQAADAQVAQAEEYCRRLVHQAREYYDRVVSEATQQANEAAARLAETYEAAGEDAPTGVEREALEQRIAWLHTFAEVTQVQLRSVLEALTREVDKLGDLPDASGTHLPATRHVVGPPARIGR